MGVGGGRNPAPKRECYRCVPSFQVLLAGSAVAGMIHWGRDALSRKLEHTLSKGLGKRVEQLRPTAIVRYARRPATNNWIDEKVSAHEMLGTRKVRFSKKPDGHRRGPSQNESDNLRGWQLRFTNGYDSKSSSLSCFKGDEIGTHELQGIDEG